jgi:hypothetical protein
MKKEELSYLNKLKERAEEIYEEMYEASSPVGAGAYFSEIKELMYKALNIAMELGLDNEVKKIEKRLENIRRVYESQMQ